MTVTTDSSKNSLTVINGIPLIQINKLWFDVLDSSLIIDEDINDIDDLTINDWRIFRSEFLGSITCSTTKPHIPEALGFERRIDDGTNYRFISRV